MGRRSTGLRIAFRIALALSLIAAALTGAFIATELRPPNHVAAERQHAVRLPAPLHIAQAAPATTTATASGTATATASATASETETSLPTATSTPAPTPAAPTRAMLVADAGRALPYGAWTRSRTLTLRIMLAPPRAADTLVAQVEVQPAERPFTGKVTAQGAPVEVQAGESAQTTIAVANLEDGLLYHWRVRARSASGTFSTWSGGGLFGVNTVAPAAPRLVSSSVPLRAWSKSAPVTMRWSETAQRAPISYYAYALVGGVQPEQAVVWHQTHDSSLTLPALAQGYWHLRVQAVDAAGNRSAVTDWAFGLASDGPPAPRIVSANPADGATSNVITPTIRWAGAAAAAPLAGFEYRLSPESAPPVSVPWTPAAGTKLALSRLADGHWSFQLRSVDVVGNYSPPVMWSFRLDRVRPTLTALALFTTSFTPPIEHLHLRFKLNKAATVTYRVLAVGSKKVLLSHSIGMQQLGTKALTWDGYLAHRKLAPAGNYTLVIDAADAAGSRIQVSTAPVSVLDKRILISLSKEALWAYQGKTLLLHTLVTNGGPDTPTLPGIFHVLGRYPNFVFHSPWPKGSPLWYPDSPTTYALLYQAQGGYFIHDAPWRSVYGPGSNSVAGTPGGNYTGSHGCTNVPFDQMQWLYAWADPGTLIQIVK